VPTTDELDEIREEIKQERGDVCIQIEIEDDPRHGGYVCMTQTRSRPAPPHDCSIGKITLRSSSSMKKLIIQ